MTPRIDPDHEYHVDMGPTHGKVAHGQWLSSQMKWVEHEN